jgi:hypothetical protein
MVNSTAVVCRNDAKGALMRIAALLKSSTVKLGEVREKGF